MSNVVRKRMLTAAIRRWFWSIFEQQLSKKNQVFKGRLIAHQRSEPLVPSNFALDATQKFNLRVKILKKKVSMEKRS